MSVCLSGIYTYPIKSCRGFFSPTATLDKRGLEHDRVCMVVDRDGKMVTQRENPKLALISPDIRGQVLQVEVPGKGMAEIDLRFLPEKRKQVTCWDDTCTAIDLGLKPAYAISEFIEQEVRLVMMDEDFDRKVTAKQFKGDANTAFTDGFPLLLTSEASLAMLNTKLATPIGMSRFRPNLVVAGCKAFEEDRWRRIRIGDVEFDVCKPCPRCVVITIDQETCEKDSEPLTVLNQYRKHDGKVMFGQNLVHASTGEISIGMDVEILK